MNQARHILGSLAVLAVALACSEASAPGPNASAAGAAPQKASAASPPASTPATQSAGAIAPANADPGSVQASSGAAGADEGKRLYFTACANCHGPDGTGAMMRQMLPKIGDLTSAEMHGRLKDDDIASLITTGRDKMPPFGSIFKPDQIKSIIAYVRTLKKG